MSATIQQLDTVKKTSSVGGEYWMARDIMEVLGYANWTNFQSAIERAIASCKSSGGDSLDHFAITSKMVEIGSGTKRNVEDWFLTRYACYLIAMNGDSAKPQIADAQRYFAIQTRNQELGTQISDEDRRLLLRDRVKDGNKRLGSAAKKAGVLRYGIFHDAGYQGLYGMGLAQIKQRKGLQKKEDLYDRAGSAELAANEFRITQTEESLTKKNIKGELSATQEHKRIGTKVRQTIKDLGNTLPENLPTAPSIKKLESERRRTLKNK